MKRFPVLLTIFLAICFAQTILGQKSFKLGFVRVFDDNGDSIWLANTKKKDRIDSRAVARFGYQTKGKINVNGRDLNLRHVSGNLPDKNFKIGRGGYDIWKGKNITVRIDYVFTWLCPPKDEQCEVYYYKGVLRITYGGKTRKVNINGYGGS